MRYSYAADAIWDGSVFSTSLPRAQSRDALKPLSAIAEGTAGRLTRDGPASEALEAAASPPVLGVASPGLLGVEAWFELVLESVVSDRRAYSMAGVGKLPKRILCSGSDATRRRAVRPAMRFRNDACDPSGDTAGARNARLAPSQPAAAAMAASWRPASRATADDPMARPEICKPTGKTKVQHHIVSITSGCGLRRRGQGG